MLQLYKPQEESLFGAEPTPQQVCYERFENGADVVYVAALEDSLDISSLVFDVIDKARPGYLALAAIELQPVEVLISINPSPPDMSLPPSKRKRGADLAHVAGAVSSVCRVAIFASNTLTTGTPHLEFTIAHELFHCIQGLWSNSRPANFVTEAGADYFAYEVLDKLCTGPQVALGRALDANTITGSLLDASYEAWFFWAFLAERKNVAPQSIAQVHEAIHNGAAMEDSVLGLIGDAPKVMNEFFVRLVGPGVACDFKGSRFSKKLPIDKKETIELPVVSVWHGTRYQLEYDKKKLFEQFDDGAGPIGMAEFDERGAEDEWVVTEPEVRTTCKKKELWMVVVSPLEVGSSSAVPRELEIDAVKPGGCDPCLIGSWSVDIATFESLIESKSPADVDIVGDYTLSFGAGPPAGGLEFSDRRQTVMAFPDTGTAIGIAVDSSGSGTYTAQDDFLKSEGYAVSGTGSAVGLPIDASSPFAASGDGGAPYTCEDDDLAVMIDGVSLEAVRMPATPEGQAYFG